MSAVDRLALPSPVFPRPSSLATYLPLALLFGFLFFLWDRRIDRWIRKERKRKRYDLIPVLLAFSTAQVVNFNVFIYLLYDTHFRER